MSALPDQARVVVIGAGIVGNSMAYHLARLGWRDIVLLEKGMLPNPGGSTGHASNFIFLTDHGKEMAAFTMESARQYRELGVYDETGGIEVARTPERMDELKRRMASSTSWGVEGSRLLTPGRGQGDGPVHRGVRDPRRVLHAGRRDRRLAPGRDAHAPEGPGDGRADDRRQRRGHRHRRRGRPGPPRPHRRRHDRHRRRRHRLRRLEPADRPDGRRLDPAHAGGPPDDRHRPGPDVRERHQRSRLSDRPRHGHEHVRAAARQRLRDRLVRPSGDPHGRRRHPVDRGVRPLADDAAVHPGGLRPATRGRPRAVPRDRRRRIRRGEARDQRPAVADPGRQPDHRRDAGGQGPLVRRRGLDQGSARDREDGRRVDDERRTGDRSPRLGHRPLLRPPEDRPAHRRPDDRGLQQDLRHRPPERAVGVEPADPPLPVLRSGEGSGGEVLRGRGLGAALLVRGEQAAPRRVRRPGHAPRRPNGSRAGGRRSSTPSTSRCATGSGSSICPRS